MKNRFLYNIIPAWQRVAYFIVAVSSACLLFCCGHPPKNKSHSDVSNESIEKGKILAASYCQSCHLLPEPSQLSAGAWENGVLPAMGPRLGIYAYGFARYPNYRNDKDLPAGFYPSHPVLNSLQWQNIIDYYTALSPDTLLPQPNHLSIDTNLTAFIPQYSKISYPSPAVCMTIIDTSRHQLFAFDLVRQFLFNVDASLQHVDRVATGAVITNIDFRSDTMLACNIGQINPNNGRFGKAQILYGNSKQHFTIDSNALFENLQRPVQLVSCDLNKDGKTDYVVCEFGHLTGALSWMENLGNGHYSHHIIRAEPGAIKTIVEDVNHDGLPDIWALFSQGNEGILLFVNNGKGGFNSQEVLRFPPVYGSTSFELVDFNKDGLNDILYTCGDNADFSIELKPYHGVYIFLNQGNNHFQQQYFFPINGCYKAIARDFDGDGDNDIAAIAFSADFARQPMEGFVYLENHGDFHFKPFTLAALQKGRWLTMDAGDLDGDGKIDIVLGNFSIRPSDIQPHANWLSGPPLIVLKNQSK